MFEQLDHAIYIYMYVDTIVRRLTFLLYGSCAAAVGIGALFGAGEKKGFEEAVGSTNGGHFFPFFLPFF